MRSTLPPPPARSSLPEPPAPPAPVRRARSRPWRFIRRIHIVALLAAIAVGLVTGLDGAGGIIFLFIILVPFEKMFRRHDQPIRRPGLRTDLTYALISPVLNFIGIVAGIAVTLLIFPIWLPGLLLRPLVTAQPGWLLAVEAVLLLDILIYWTHRLSHEIGFFWRFHSIHHSSERMDWISGVRAHPFDGIIIVGPAVFLLVAGFNLQVVGIAAIIQAVLGLVAHANIRWRLRPLHRIVMTPEFHHWHHSSHPDSIHTNYSVFLPIWDMIWGTYRMPADERPQVYGQSENTPPSVPGQMVAPFSKEMRDKYPFPPVWRARLRRLVPFRRRTVAAS